METMRERIAVLEAALLAAKVSFIKHPTTQGGPWLSKGRSGWPDSGFLRHQAVSEHNEDIDSVLNREQVSEGGS